MIRQTLLSLIFVTAAMAVADQPLPESAKVGFFYAGCQAYTFKSFDLMTAFEKIAAAGGKTVDFFPGHLLNKADPKSKFDHNTTAEQRAPVKVKLKELGLTPVGYGVVRLPNNEEECRKIFDFCKDMGVGLVVSEPADDAFDLIEKLVKEYDIKMGIHNHPKKPLDRSYRYWDPEYVLSLVKDRDPRMGSCADIGHWVRSGVKPTDAIKILKGRIFDSHVKDLDAFGVREAKDMVWGTGQSDIPAVLNLYAEQGFLGPLDVEWEKDWETSLPDVTKCLEFVKNFKPATTK
jgi:sugar phosphate isomerase/epimerase